MDKFQGPGDGDSPPEVLTLATLLRAQLDALYAAANAVVEGDSVDSAVAELGDWGRVVDGLAKTKHASRGAFLTLATYKAHFPSQDIRYNKAEHPGGFSARAIDSTVTVPFLRSVDLYTNVESHWLTQTLSFADPWTRAITLKTTPRSVGPALIESVNRLEEFPPEEQASRAASAAKVVLARLIEERNRSKVEITRPKGLTVAEVSGLLVGLMDRPYKRAAPRLPQVMIFAMYIALFQSGLSRYHDCDLEELGRMKAADRKSGTVGDIVVSKLNRPVEAVETKLDVVITTSIVREAMEKVKSHSVERYLILSTAGIAPSDRTEMMQLVGDFRRSNGCEIIVDGVLPTISYYLRLLPSTALFVDSLADLLESDVELDYEHRIAWNELCAKR